MDLQIEETTVRTVIFRETCVVATFNYAAFP